MINTSLQALIQDVVVDYLNLKSIESSFLFQHNQDLVKNIAPKRIRCKLPKLASDISKIASSTMHHPALKSTHYHPTNIYKIKDDNRNLTRLPLTRDSKRVLTLDAMNLYKTHPFQEENNQTSSKMLKGKEFALFLWMKICEDRNLSIERKLELFKNVLIGAGKDDKTAEKIKGEVVEVSKKLLDPRNARHIKIKDFNDKFCRICKLFHCITHFADRKSFDFKLKDTKHLPVKMRMVDPDSKKHKHYMNSKNLNETGKWLTDYECRDTHKCFKTNPIHIPYPSISNRAQFILESLLNNGVRNPCSISIFINCSCIETGHLINLLNEEYKQPLPLWNIHKPFFTDSKRHKGLIIPTYAQPCTCDGKCGASSRCSCFSNDRYAPFICSKFCECSIECSRKFLGCNCQFGQCSSNKCICYANSRECDPDLCFSCCAVRSVQYDHKSAQHTSSNTMILCQNVKIQLNLKKRTGLSISTIPGAGLGLFALEDIRNGDMITEYTGELLSPYEFERMGAIYDQHELSYLLGAEELAIDATYFGNKMKYVNHKSHDEENCKIKPWHVNGKAVMILEAGKNIKKGDELFFNYAYDLSQIGYRWYHDYESRWGS
jgi:hypothetical protein